GEDPANAVRRVPQKHTVLVGVVQIAAVVLLLLGVFVFTSFRSRIDPYLGARVSMFAGVACLLLAGLVATPLLASLVGRAVQPLSRHFLGLEGRLAADNLVRPPGRTGIVIAALAATGGLLVQTAGFLRSTREAIYEWVEDKIAADLFVTCGSPATSGGSAL